MSKMLKSLDELLKFIRETPSKEFCEIIDNIKIDEEVFKSYAGLENMIMSEAINTYLYGSRVYETNDEESDIDFICIVNNGCKTEQFEKNNCNITYHTIDNFQQLIDDHDVSALECLFLHKEKATSHEFKFELDIEKLRRSFSQKSSNSWVKAKKKIELHNEMRIGRKSLFHSLRILDFGIQIAEQGKIADYTYCGRWWKQICEQNFDNWGEYKKFWQPIYNNLRIKFRLVAPIKK